MVASALREGFTVTVGTFFLHNQQSLTNPYLKFFSTIITKHFG